MKQWLNIFRKNKGIDLENHFPGPVFWDVDPSSLDIKLDKDFIIERVLARNMGNEIYFEKLEELYPKREIKKIALSSSQIRGNNTIRAIANRYGIDPNRIKNYNPAFG